MMAAYDEEKAPAMLRLMISFRDAIVDAYYYADALR